MPTRQEIMNWLNPDRIPGEDWEITGVAPLERAQRHQMAFYRGGAVGATPADIAAHDASQAGLKLSKGGFAKAAWHFFPPPEPHISIGRQCEIHGMASIGKHGFGYTQGLQFPHYGGVWIGDNVEIGAFTCVDRGVFGNTVIGNSTKIDNLVHVAHNVDLGARTLVVAGSVLGGSCRIGEDTYIGMHATIRDHAKVGDRCIIAMGAVVTKDVPDDTVAIGVPAVFRPRKAGELEGLTNT